MNAKNIMYFLTKILFLEEIASILYVILMFFGVYFIFENIENKTIAVFSVVLFLALWTALIFVFSSRFKNFFKKEKS